jgi:hypothetical protein
MDAQRPDGELTVPPVGRREHRLNLTRPRGPGAGELDYDSTVTAPTEWVPYVYTDTELRSGAGGRGLSVASLVFGLAGLLIALFGVWGAPLSLVAVMLTVMARRSERLGGALWAWGMVAGLVGLAIVIAWLVIISQALDRIPY